MRNLAAKTTYEVDTVRAGCYRNGPWRWRLKKKKKRNRSQWDFISFIYVVENSLKGAVEVIIVSTRADWKVGTGKEPIPRKKEGDKIISHTISHCFLTLWWFSSGESPGCGGGGSNSRRWVHLFSTLKRERIHPWWKSIDQRILTLLSGLIWLEQWRLSLVCCPLNRSPIVSIECSSCLHYIVKGHPHQPDHRCEPCPSNRSRCSVYGYGRLDSTRPTKTDAESGIDVRRMYNFLAWECHNVEWSPRMWYTFQPGFSIPSFLMPQVHKV